MSHFSVLVVGDDVDAQLAPYHEFESTGIDDEHVREIDITEEARTRYEQDTTRAARDPEGKLHAFFDEQGAWVPGLSQTAADKFDTNRRTYFVPVGWEQVEVPTAQLETFARFVRGYYGLQSVKSILEIDRVTTHKYGYVLVTDSGEVLKVVNRTNPNSKWDWYTVGGRWSNFLLRKDGQRVDAARKSDVDFAALQQEAREKATQDWRVVHEVIGPHLGGFITWEVMCEQHGGSTDKAREAYHAQPLQRARAALPQGHPAARLMFWDGPEKFLAPEAEFVAAAEDRALSTFAVVKDGEWNQKGEMGWFGFARGECVQADWNKSVREMLATLPDDTLLTVVDCHI